MNYSEEQFKRIHYIEHVMESFLPEETGYEKTVLEAINYSVKAGGKRVRPMLMLESYRLFHANYEKDKLLSAFIAAIELIHTYSLVHDDLPAMDNDDYRRGRKTTHVVYGEAMGILAGDGLLNYAFEIAGKAVSESKYFTSMQRGAKAFHVLALKSGIKGMLGGQVADIEACGNAIDNKQLEFIYKLKTGALIEASMLIGGILAGASESEQALLSKAALNIGLAFQIQDDILDVTSTLEVLGKPICSDEKNDKTTYVTLNGVEAAKEKVQMLSEEAAERIDELDGENLFLKELIRALIYRVK